jgi:hypothetical protein
MYFATNTDICVFGVVMEMMGQACIILDANIISLK